jgi:tetratricopeptide (TPR) repeat protein
MELWLNVIIIAGPLVLGTYLSIQKNWPLTKKIVIWIICLSISSVGVIGIIKQQKEEKEKEKKEKYYHQLQEKQELRGRGLPEKYIDGLGENPLLKHFFNNGQNYEKEYKFKQAIAEYEKCLSHPEATEENKVAANNLIGNCHYYVSELKDAEIHYKEAISISEKVKDKTERLKGKSAALTNLGSAYNGLGDFKKAIEYHEKSLEI